MGGYYALNGNEYHYKYDGSAWTSVSTLPYTFYDRPAIIHENNIHILGLGDSTLLINTINGLVWNGYRILIYRKLFIKVPL